MTEVHDALSLAEQFDARLNAANVIPNGTDPVPVRFALGSTYVWIARAHARGFRQLLTQSNYPAALALIRPQFEAVLRGWWLAFGAPDNFVSDLEQAANNASGKEPNFPKMYNMIDALEAAPRLHGTFTGAKTAEALRSLKEKAMPYLHSYAHGGVHSLLSKLQDPDPPLMVWYIKTSNSLVYSAFLLYSCMTNDSSSTMALYKVRQELDHAMHQV